MDSCLELTNISYKRLIQGNLRKHKQNEYQIASNIPIFTSLRPAQSVGVPKRTMHRSTNPILQFLQLQLLRVSPPSSRRGKRRPPLESGARASRGRKTKGGNGRGGTGSGPAFRPKRSGRFPARAPPRAPVPEKKLENRARAAAARLRRAGTFQAPPPAGPRSGVRASRLPRSTPSRRRGSCCKPAARRKGSPGVRAGRRRRGERAPG